MTTALSAQERTRVPPPENRSTSDSRPPAPYVPSTPRSRQEWLEQWALQNPNATVRTAQAAVQQRFRHGIGNARVSQILAEARATLEQRKSIPQTHADPGALAVLNELGGASSISHITRTMRMLGIRAIELLPDGSCKIAPSEG